MKQKLLCFLMLGILLIGSAYAQERRISGRVTSSEDGAPIAGVSVLAVGTGRATQTDELGTFSLDVASNVTALEFRYLGYVTQTITLGSRTTISVVLETDATAIDEVVVVGYGSARSLSNVVGSVKHISGQVLESRPSANALDALQGQIAGVQIFSSNGEPSVTPSIRLHGSGSLGASSTPLIVLDGIPIDPNSLVSLNPEDFESVTVLKDASATSIYGSRAANGVIYLTSKKGKRNSPPSISLKSQYGVSQMAQTDYFKDVFTSPELFDFWLETGFRNQEQVDNLRENWPHDTRWFDVYYLNNQPFSQTDLSVTGGGDRTTYYISGGYLNSEGLSYRSGFERYTLRSNLATDISSWIKVGMNLSVGTDGRQTNPYGTNSLNRGLAMLSQPFYTPYDEDGNLYYEQQIPGLARFHPKYLADMITADQRKVLFNPSGYIQMTPLKGLTLKVQGGLEFFDLTASGRTYASYNNLYNGSASESLRRDLSKTITNTIEYAFDAAEKHRFTLLGGHEFIDYDRQEFSASSNGHTDDRLMLLSAGPNNRNVGQSRTQYVFNSFFGRVSYGFDDKYLFDATVRQDASSRFGRDNRYATFWSLGGLWRAKNENFLRDLDWLTDLNVRASVGTSGNSQIENYESLALIGTNIYNGQTGWGISAPGNPALAWESQFKGTAGVSAVLFNLATVELEYYHRITDNMLVDVPYPYTSGFADITSNVGKLRNRGVDIDVSADVIRTGNLRVTPRFNMNYNQETVLELFQGNDYWIIPNTGVSWAVGQPRGYFYPVWAGVNPDNGDPQWYVPNEDPDMIVVPNKDPNNVTTSFNAGELQQNTGLKRYPPVAGGFGLTSNYKGIEFGFDFAFISGKYLINNDRYFTENPNQFAGYNQSRVVADYWKNPGDNARFPRYGVQFTQFDSRLIENASFTRLKNVTLGYNFPKSLLDRTGFLRGAKVFFVGRNLLTWTQYTGPDPEVDSNLTLGVNPNTKQYTFGLQVQL
ncbi:SusC/RagA family TonB-linked outer membrane protein [Parapedobacter deserti]|uniref:SusC/RagA family TonB-linked outer membrane protein n=1 Tax=Parapedobacter deserti TaxID=1912957 RepID=A0ABV7JFS4_9SPHI